jgi:exosortase/archaeosortase family protein
MFYLYAIDKYFNYIKLLRWLLLHCALWLLQLFGYKAYLHDAFTIRLQGGRGVHVVYECIGYGVMIFWIAFVFANKGNFIKKIKWIAGGLLLIWTINVVRISLMLVAVNNNWPTLLNLDNHAWFNIAAYTAILLLIFLFDKFNTGNLVTASPVKKDEQH